MKKSIVAMVLSFILLLSLTLSPSAEGTTDTTTVDENGNTVIYYDDGSYTLITPAKAVPTAMTRAAVHDTAGEVSAINYAKDSIKLVNPYLTLNHKLKKALKKAVKRGVKVEVMVSAHSDIPLTPDCVFYNVHKLMKHGVDVYIYEPGFHHTKIIMVDGRFCTVGSANLNSRSLNFDYEENAVIVDPCTTKQLSKMFERDKNRSFKLTQQRWRKFRTPWQRFVGWFAHLLAPVI